MLFASDYSHNGLPVVFTNNLGFRANHTWADMLQLNLLVAPAEKFDTNERTQLNDILQTHFGERRREDNAFWLIGISLDKGVDEKSAIRNRFSDLDLDYDDDVFVYTMGGKREECPPNSAVWDMYIFIFCIGQVIR